MKTKEILKELLEIGVEVILVPFSVSRYKIINPKNILSYKGSYYQATRQLARNKLVGFREGKGTTTIYLTKRGKKVALKYSLEDLEIKKPKKWDNKWRIIIFDIPERHKNGRHALQLKLNELGFIMLQKSVYIHPYECIDEIDFVRTVYNIRPYVKYILADDIESAKQLLWQFNKKGTL